MRARNPFTRITQLVQPSPKYQLVIPSTRGPRSTYRINHTKFINNVGNKFLPFAFTILFATYEPAYRVVSCLGLQQGCLFYCGIIPVIRVSLDL